MAINNTWKKRKGKEEGTEREKIWDLGFLVVVCCFFLLTPCEAENPHSIPSPNTSHWGKVQPRITIPMLGLGVSPSLGCPNPQKGPSCDSQWGTT